MKQKLILLMLLLLIMITTNVIARECLNIEDSTSGCDIIVFTINATDPSQVYNDAACTINLTSPSGSDSITTMTNGGLGVGWHNYTFIESTSGVWLFHITCVKSSQYAHNSGIITVDLSIFTIVDGLNESTYNYFVSGSNEDLFKANISSLATSEQLSNTNTSIITHGDANWGGNITATFSIDYNAIWNVSLNQTWISQSSGEFVYELYTYPICSIT